MAGTSFKISYYFSKPFLLFFFALFLLSTQLKLSAQTPAFESYAYKVDKTYLKSYWTVAKKIPTGPARWKTAEWVAMGVILAGGTIVYIYDNQIREFIQRSPSLAKDNTATYFFEPWGSGLYPAALLGGFYIYGLTAEDLRARQIALGGVQAFIMSGLTAEIIKQLTHRYRPYQSDPANPRLWDGPFTGFEYTSFPSGHTTTAFAIASLVSSVYKDKIWVGILSYGIASGVAWSRVYQNQHWPSDVFIGAALGFAIGKTIYHVMQGKTNLTMGISDTGGVALVYHL